MKYLIFALLLLIPLAGCDQKQDGAAAGPAAGTPSPFTGRRGVRRFGGRHRRHRRGPGGLSLMLTPAAPEVPAE